jgi:xylulose-5-phosphate/fructose-6-phosphate phosphoketolase
MTDQLDPPTASITDIGADDLLRSEGVTVAPVSYVLSDAPGPLDTEQLRVLDAWWRAANYLSVGQIYLMDNPLLDRALRPEDVKPRLLGHWGTTPGLNFIYAHANRVIRARDLDAVYVMGPGHGGPGPNACAWLEGTYSERYPTISRDREGMRRFFRQFSFPGGVPSHLGPPTPGSFHEGGELGYSLLHAFGAALDHPRLTVFCVVGDGEAETGPLAASWHANKFLSPLRDGAVLPILHLNGYKIANPTLLARIPEADLVDLLRGYGYEPLVVTVELGSNPAEGHQALAAALDACLDGIAGIQERARQDGDAAHPRWPMIVLRSPKGWTGPPIVDGLQVEGTFRAHQVPIPAARDNDDHRRALEAWMRSYRPEGLFDRFGQPVAELVDLPPLGDRRMSANPVANGGVLVRDLQLPDFRDYRVPVPQPGGGSHEATRVLGSWLRDVIVDNPENFLLFGPDEVASNRLSAVFEVTGRKWIARTDPSDDHLSPDGRVVEVLSEHICQGLLEGYILTGRHGLFTCYEAFVHIVDAMFNQHSKWLESASAVPWRPPIASLNYLLTSHVWRQDHNGTTHQDPGFLDVVMNKKPEIVRVYLPPDTNCLLSVADHCLRSRNYVNVIVSGKQPELDYLSMDEAVSHCTRGIGIWDWAGSETVGQLPDVVLACAGDVPTLETLAAADILRRQLPDLAVRFVNVVDLMRLVPDSEHPHGLNDAQFDAIFTVDRPVIFAFHGYPWLIHRLTYRRTNHHNIHVRGYKENGTTTTPFDMVMLNDLDRYHLVIDVIDRVPGLGPRAGTLRQTMTDARFTARSWTRDHGEDLPEIVNWSWPNPRTDAVHK